MPVTEYKPVTVLFSNKGVDLRTVADELAVAEYAALSNFITDQEGSVRSRRGSLKLNGSALASLDVHTLWRLKSNAASYRYAGANDRLYRASTPFTAYAQITPGATWIASVVYKVGDFVIPSPANGHTYRCTVAGTSGGSQPVFATAAGTATTDNTVTWTESNFSGAAILPEDYAVGIDTKPWSFFCDANAFVKDSGTGSPSIVGIVPPSGVATVSTNSYSSKTIETFEDYTVWSETDPSAILTLSNEGTIKKVGTYSLKCAFSGAGQASIAENKTLDLTTFGATSSADTDPIHIWVYSTAPENIGAMLLQFSIGDTSFNEHYEKSIAPSPVQPGVNFTSTIPQDANSAAFQTNLFNTYISNGVLIDASTGLPVDQGNAQDLANFQSATLEPGKNVWTEFKINKSDFLAALSTGTANGFASVKAIRISFDITGAVDIYFDDWTLLGGGTLQGTDYTWEYVYRNSTTGTVSNPSPASANPTTAPNRNPVAVTVAYSRDPQVDKIDIYRLGGTTTTYSFSGSVTNNPVAAGMTVVYTDNIADALLGSSLESDNARPLNFAALVLHNETLFGWGAAGDPPNAVRFSKRVYVEQWPTSYLLYVGSGSDKVVRLLSNGTQLFAVTLSQVYVIIGSDAASYQALSTGFNRGMDDNIFGLCKTPAGAAFAAYDGLYEYPTGRKLSQPIDGVFHGLTINGITPINSGYLSLIRLAFYDNDIHVYYPSGSATSNDAEMIFDTLYERWEPSTIAARTALAEKDTNILVIGKTNGNIYQVETGTTDDGTAIAISLQTKFLDLGIPGADKIWSDMSLDLDTGGQNISMQLIFNNGDVSDSIQTVNTASRTLTPVSIFSGAGEKALNCQLKITGSVSSQVTLYKAIFYVKEEPPYRASFQTEWTDNGYPYDKYWKEILLEIDTASIASTVHLDIDNVLDVVPTFSVTTSGRQRVTLSVPRDTIGKIARLRITGTPVKLYTFEFVVQNDPPDVTIADSLEQLFGYDRFKFLKRAWITYKASSTLSMAVYADEYLWTTETIPASSLASGWVKAEVRLPPKIKGKLFRFVFTSSASFKIYWEMSEIEFKIIDPGAGYQRNKFRPPALM
jgi:hypothetical protein